MSIFFRGIFLLAFSFLSNASYRKNNKDHFSQGKVLQPMTVEFVKKLPFSSQGKSYEEHLKDCLRIYGSFLSEIHDKNPEEKKILSQAFKGKMQEQHPLDIVDEAVQSYEQYSVDLVE